MTKNRHVAGFASIIASLKPVAWPLISQYVLVRRAPDVHSINLEFNQNGRRTLLGPPHPPDRLRTGMHMLLSGDLFNAEEALPAA